MTSFPVTTDHFLQVPVWFWLASVSMAISPPRIPSFYETCSEHKEGNHAHRTLLDVENGSQNPIYLCISQTVPLLIPPPIVPHLLPTSSPLRGCCPLSQVSPHPSASSFYRVRSILSHHQYRAALCVGGVLSPAIWFVTQSLNVTKGPGQLMVLIFLWSPYSLYGPQFFFQLMLLIFLWSSYPLYGPLFFQLFHKFLTFVQSLL